LRAAELEARSVRAELMPVVQATAATMPTRQADLGGHGYKPDVDGKMEELHSISPTYVHSQPFDLIGAHCGLD
jgi:hypothetical protein